jgi:hypothetical protein
MVYLCLYTTGSIYSCAKWICQIYITHTHTHTLTHKTVSIYSCAQWFCGELCVHVLVSLFCMRRRREREDKYVKRNEVRSWGSNPRPAQPRIRCFFSLLLFVPRRSRGGGRNGILSKRGSIELKTTWSGFLSPS